MRLHNWPSRLTATFAASRALEIDWSVHDCFRFGGKVAEALTGKDPTTPLHGRYHDYASGLKAAREVFGAVGLIGLGDHFWNRVPRHLAHRGDWAVARLPGVKGWALLIVDNGLLRDARGGVLPLTEARLCWRVE